MMTRQAELKKQAYASNLKSRALSILIYLIDRSNKELTCFPAITTMAEQLHISISTVKRALHELVDGGFIKKSARHREGNRGQTSNLYTLIPQESTSLPKQTKKSTEPASAIVEVEEYTTTKKLENNAVSTITHLTFERLKSEQQQKSIKPESQIMELETIPAKSFEDSQKNTNSSTPKPCSESVEESSSKYSFLFLKLNLKEKFCKLGKVFFSPKILFFHTNERGRGSI